MLNQNECLFLIVDIQDKLLKSIYNKKEVLSRAVILAKTAKLLGIPVVVTEQNPQKLGSTVEELKTELPENTQYLEKVTFSAIANEDILNAINAHNKKQVILFGLESHICVYQTYSDLLWKNYHVTIAKDASSSRSEFEHTTAVDRCDSKTVEMILFELLRSSEHPQFKEVQALIK